MEAKVSYIHDSWDEWVPEERIMKYTPENLVKQQELRVTQASVKKAVKIPEKKISEVKKRRRESTAEKVFVVDQRKKSILNDQKSKLLSQKR